MLGGTMKLADYNLHLERWGSHTAGYRIASWILITFLIGVLALHCVCPCA